MNASEFSIQYPLFMLKRSEIEYFGFPYRPDKRKPETIAIPVFTSDSKAREFLLATRKEYDVHVYKNEACFRQSMRSMRNTGQMIAFDPRALWGGRILARHVYPPAEVEERFLSEPWGWEYPVYVLLGWGNYRYLEGRPIPNGGPPGELTKMLVVLTDMDLANREIMTDLVNGWVAVPIESPEEFARFLRRLPGNVTGAVFDPPSENGTYSIKTYRLRDELIAKLEASI